MKTKADNYSTPPTDGGDTYNVDKDCSGLFSFRSTTGVCLNGASLEDVADQVWISRRHGDVRGAVATCDLCCTPTHEVDLCIDDNNEGAICFTCRTFTPEEGN